MAIVDQLIAVFGYELRNQDVPGKWKKGIDGAEKSAASAAKNLERRIADVARTAARVGTIIGTAIGTAASAIGVGAIKTSAQFESYKATLTTIEGDAQKAQQSLDWIAKFARTTPYELSQVTEAFVRMKAYGLDPADGSLEALGNVASAMGKPMMQAVEAMADATTMEFERLKEFGIKAKQEGNNVTFTWTQNGKELSKTVKKNSEEVSRFLIGNFSRFEGAMDLQSRTWNGIVSNLGDTWTDFLRRVGDAGVFDFAKSRLEGFMQRIDQWDKDGTIDKWAKRFSSAFSGIIAAVEWTANEIGGHIDFIIKAFEGIDGNKAAERLKWIAGAFGLLLWAVWPLARKITGIAVALDDVLKWAQGGESKFGDLIEWFSKITGASEPVATALAAISGALALMAFMYPFGMVKAFAAILGFAAKHTVVTAMAVALKALGAAYASLGGLGLLKMLGKASVAGIVAAALGYTLGSATDATGKSAQPGDVLPNGTVMTDDNDGRDSAADDYLLGPPVKRPDGSVYYPGAPKTEYSPDFIDPNGGEGLRQQLGAIFQNFMNANGKTTPQAGAAAVMEDIDPNGGEGLRQQLGAIFQNFMNANGKTTPQAGAAAVMEDHRVQSDQRNQSVNVDVGGVRVEVQSPDAAPGATGAAVGAAIGGAASTAVPAATRNEAPILQ